MKDQEQKNPKNKRLLTYYLILGACILIIAAVAIAVTLSLTLGGKSRQTIDADNEQNEEITDDTDAGDGDNEDAEDTATETGFAMPVSEITLLNDYCFYHNTTLDKYYLHTGIDFGADAGTEVYAVLDGTVESIVTGSVLNGSTITITHDNGITTVYTYVDAVETLSVGDTVTKGEVIGTVSEATGKEYKDGAHLHFEVWLDGVAVDPSDYLDMSEK